MLDGAPSWGGEREALERQAKGVGVTGIDQDAMGQDITTNEPLDDLTLQGHFDHGDHGNDHAVGKRQGHIVYVTGMRSRGRGGDVGHATRGQLKLSNDLVLDGCARGTRVNQRRDLYRVWNRLTLLPEEVRRRLRYADANLAHRACALEIRKLNCKGRHERTG